jgi:hypothetical protein
LAVKLNGGEFLGICGGPDAPCCVLERATAAPPGQIPLWGQIGDYTININGMPVRIEQDGIYGICGDSGMHLGFGAHAVDYQRPFISETGYRSFLGCHVDMVPGMTLNVLAGEIIKARFLPSTPKSKAASAIRIARNSSPRLSNARSSGQPFSSPSLTVSGATSPSSPRSWKAVSISSAATIPRQQPTRFPSKSWQ